MRFNLYSNLEPISDYEAKNEISFFKGEKSRHLGIVDSPDDMYLFRYKGDGTEKEIHAAISMIKGIRHGFSAIDVFCCACAKNKYGMTFRSASTLDETDRSDDIQDQPKGWTSSEVRKYFPDKK